MKNIEMNFTAGVEYRGKIYASLLNINGLIEFNLATQELRYVKRFAKEKAHLGLHQRAFLYKNEAWFIPKLGEYIVVVDLDTFHMDYIKPPYKVVRGMGERLYYPALYYSGEIIGERFLYLVPTNTDALLVIDLEIKQIYPYYDIPIEKEYFINAAYANGKICLFPDIGDEMIELDLHTKEIQTYSWENLYGSYVRSCEKYINMIYHEGRLWIIPFRADDILSIDLEMDEVEKIPLGEHYDEECTYHEAFVEGNVLYLFPFYGEKILKLNIVNKQLSTLDLGKKWFENEKNGLIRLYSHDKFIFSSTRKSLLFIYDLEKDSLDSKKMVMDRDILLERLDEETEGKGLLRLKEVVYDDCYVEDILGLENFICAIEQNKYSGQNIDMNNGIEIWDAVKR